MTIEILVKCICHIPKWDKIFLSVYLKQLHDPNLYTLKKMTIL